MLRPERILAATKFRYIGDTVVAVPALRALRRRYPCAHTTLLTGSSAAQAMMGCPYVDEIVSYDHHLFRRKPSELIEFVRELRSRQFDFAVLFNRSFHIALATFLSRIPVRAGHTVEGRGFLLNRRVVLKENRHEIDSLLDVAAACGAPAAGRHLELWVPPEERREAAALLELVPDGRPIVAIQPGANEPQRKQWNAAGFVHAAIGLHSETGCRVLLVGGENEAGAAGAVAQRLPMPYMNAVGRTTLRQALGAIANCDLFIGGDTGLTHCAVGIGVPTVAIHGPVSAARWGFVSDTSRVLFAQAHSKDPDDRELRACLDAVMPGSVVEASLELMSRKVGKGP